MTRRLFLSGVVLLACLSSGHVTNLLAQEPLDGRNRIFHDDLLDNLVGDWKLNRKIRGQFAGEQCQGRVGAKPSILASAYEGREQSADL